MHDIIIRNGAIVDGTGRASFKGDIAIRDGLISAIGSVEGEARREIDATGLLVTPGFVDIHTHYDGQATWDGELAPSSWHGVTTVVMGNCGVGFAPVKANQHELLINIMEGVEDIPGAALYEGLTWGWETFPEYMDVLDRVPHAIDIAAQVPHGAVRAYVMGERGAANEAATAEDIVRMKQVVLDGLKAGAVGFSTSRMMLHLSKDGVPVPGTFANEDELLGIAHAIGEAGHGVFEVSSDMTPAEPELEWMAQISKENNAPVVYSFGQYHKDPEIWRKMLSVTERANESGARVFAAASSRGVGVLFSWEANLHPFSFCPSFHPLVAMSREERNATLADPAFRARLLSEEPVFMEQFAGDDNLLSRREIMEGACFNYANMYSMEGPDGIDYEPSREMSIAAIAEREGRSPREVIYDMLTAREGRQTIYYPIGNYAYAHYDHVLEMFDSSSVVASLSDGGAHVGVMCDGSQPTFMLTHWVRDRKRGGRLSLERAVELQTGITASIYGLDDRGVIAVGKRADLNLIDFDNLSIGYPEMHYDLPTGAKRYLQKPEGYVATIVAGQVIRQDGKDTGARPGRLIRAGSHCDKTPLRESATAD